MEPAIKEKQIYEAFEVSLALKGIHAAVELVSGALLLFVDTTTIANILTYFSRGEIIEDPKDIISNYLSQTAQHLSGSAQAFAAWYLLIHGVINAVLVIGLFRKKLWSYPLSLAVIGLFTLYQVYRYTFTQSIWLLILTVFDLIVMWLIWHEYQVRKKATGGVA